MTWTTTRPIIAGSYWWRNLNTHYRAQVCKVFYNRTRSNGERLSVAFTDGACYQLEEMLGGEWAGPLPEPDEPTERDERETQS